MKQVNLRYDPNLSIEENAAKCGVTVHAIRKYIQTNGIDRRHDAKLSKFLAVQKAKTEKPNATVTEIAKELGIGTSHASNILRALKKYDLVVCCNPNVRKGRLYKCTDLGLEIIKKI